MAVAEHGVGEAVDRVGDSVQTMEMGEEDLESAELQDTAAKKVPEKSASENGLFHTTLRTILTLIKRRLP